MKKKNDLKVIKFPSSPDQTERRIEAILFGVTNLSELISIVNIWNSLQYSNLEVLSNHDSFWAWNKTNETDPRTWP